MVKVLRRNNRTKTCGDKVSFYTVTKAIEVAKKHKQNVYECPCCYCFHLTNRDDWHEEFISYEVYDKMRKEFISNQENLNNARKKIETQAIHLSQMEKSYTELRNKLIVTQMQKERIKNDI